MNPVQIRDDEVGNSVAGMEGHVPLVERGGFSALVSSYAGNERLSGGEVSRLFDGRVGSRVQATFQADYFTQRALGVVGGWRPIERGAYPAWSDYTSTEVREDRGASGYAMVPAGRAAKALFAWDHWYPAGDNVRLGDYGEKIRAALEEEVNGFDPGFQRAVRRDRGEVHLRVYAELSKTGARWLGFTQETYCDGYVSRAVTRNLLSSDCAAHLSVPVPAPARVTADHIVVDAAHAVPGGADRGRARFYGAESYASDAVRGRVQSASAAGVLVFPGRQALGLWGAVFAAWVWALDELGNSGEQLQVFLPNMTREMITEAFRSVGLPCSEGDEVNTARVAHWLKRSGYSPRSDYGASWTLGDRERAVTIQAYERFRYRVVGDAWRTVAHIDSAQQRLKLPVAALPVRMAAVLGIYAPLDGWSAKSNWTELETAAFDRGASMGALGDLVVQRVCGHWQNLGHLNERAAVSRLLEVWFNAIVHAGATEAGVIDLGIRVDLPSIDPGQLTADGAEVAWSVPLAWGGGNLQRREDEAENLRGNPGARADGWGESDPADPSAPVQRQGRGHRARAWLVMTRALWLPAVSGKYGPLIVQPRTTFAYDPGAGTPQEYGVRAEDPQLHATLTRGMMSGDCYLALRQRASTLPFSEVPVIRTLSSPWWEFTLASPEVLDLVASVIRVHNGSVRKYEFTRTTIGLWESGARSAVVTGRGDALLFLESRGTDHSGNSSVKLDRGESRGQYWRGVGSLIDPLISECAHDGPRVSEVELSEKDLELRRKLVPWTQQTRHDYRKLGGKWGKAFTLYRRHVPSVVAPRLDAVVEHLPCAVCEACHIDNLKTVSRSVLSNLVQIGVTDDIYLLDLAVLGGYDTVLNRVDPLETLREEFCVPAATEGKLDPRMKFWIRDTLDKIRYRRVRVSFSDLVSFRDEWANPGASTFGSNAKLEVSRIVRGQRKTRKVRLRNKWFKALAFTDEEVVKECLAGAPNLVRPFRKQDEPAKTRTVQCYDTRSLIRCTYMNQAISDLNGYGTWTTLDMDATERSHLRRRLLRDDGGYRLCTDQSSFDINQSRESVCYVIAQLFERMVRYGKNDDLARVAAAELRALDATVLTTVDEPWRKGVLSGMKYTALVDSVLNRAATMTVLERLGVSPELAVFQGDDAVALLGNQRVKVSDVAREYGDLGLDVNPQKSWFARGRCEFLHELYSGTGVYGFPARAAKTLLWQKPATGASVGGASTVREDLAMLQVAARRRLVKLRGIGRALFARIGAGLEHFDEAWDTPAVRGGLGFGTRGHMAVSIESARRRKVRVRLVSPAPYAKDVGQDLLVKACLQRASAAVSMPGYVLEVRYEKVRGVPDMPIHTVERAKRTDRGRTEWQLLDARKVEAPYLRKLRLEAKLMSKDKILSTDLPTRAFDEAPDVDRAVRWYQKTRRAVTIAIIDAKHYHEPYHGVARLGDAIWGGLCMLAAIGLAKKDRLDEQKRQLTKLLWETVVRYKVYINYHI
ncbi:CP-RdRp fusion protein [Pythium splendens RNA virus 1]|uniref:RNA-directed RNA polymerase n=2 Tax=Pythium splendens RNA virus 1 TaxID=2561873 RepID=A0A5A4RHJ6_9VIRU|nr:CP-RdRp fusion protein [Pythium splendens RNA virus 1]